MYHFVWRLLTCSRNRAIFVYSRSCCFLCVIYIIFIEPQIALTQYIYTLFKYTIYNDQSEEIKTLNGILFLKGIPDNNRTFFSKKRRHRLKTL